MNEHCFHSSSVRAIWFHRQMTYVRINSRTDNCTISYHLISPSRPRESYAKPPSIGNPFSDVNKKWISTSDRIFLSLLLLAFLFLAQLSDSFALAAARGFANFAHCPLAARISDNLGEGWGKTMEGPKRRDTVGSLRESPKRLEMLRF